MIQTDAAYQQIQQYLDIDNFIDFMVLNLFAGRVDLADGDVVERDCLRHPGAVSVVVGDSAFTRTPRPIHSSAIDLTRPEMAALVIA